MQADLLPIAKRVINEPGYAQRSIYSRADFYQAIRKVADSTRQNGETPEQAFTRAIEKDDIGRVLYAAYKKANGPDYVEPVPQPWRPQDPPMTPSLQQLYRLAGDLRQQNPELTEAQSFTRVLESPEGRKLYRQYRSEQAAG
jgi:hypothetical protein